MEAQEPLGGFMEPYGPPPGETETCAPGACGPEPVVGGEVSRAIVCLTRAHRARAAQLLREFGLHTGQEILMMHLWEHGPQRQATLAATFCIDSASMTRKVQRLERAGYVRRIPDPDDGRATRVECTPASDVLRQQIAQMWDDLERQTLDGLSPAEQAATLALLRRLTENLEKPDGRACPSAG